MLIFEAQAWASCSTADSKGCVKCFTVFKPNNLPSGEYYYNSQYSKTCPKDKDTQSITVSIGLKPSNTRVYNQISDYSSDIKQDNEDDPIQEYIFSDTKSGESSYSGSASGNLQITETSNEHFSKHPSIFGDGTEQYGGSNVSRRTKRTGVEANTVKSDYSKHWFDRDNLGENDEKSEEETENTLTYNGDGDLYSVHTAASKVSQDGTANSKLKSASVTKYHGKTTTFWFIGHDEPGFSSAKVNISGGLSGASSYIVESPTIPQVVQIGEFYPGDFGDSECKWWNKVRDVTNRFLSVGMHTDIKPATEAGECPK